MRLKTSVAVAALAAMPLAGCASTYGDGYGYGDGYYERQYRPGNYDPYALGRNDYIYRGNDGRYYCRRRDGTIGLVIGAGVGAVLGDIIAPRGSGTVGALIGGAAGAAIGYAIERNELKCQ